MATPFNEDQAEFSPDGRFIAYVSDETGRSEVFVRTFPDSGAKWSVSSGEGTEPRWAPDGKSLYYRSPTDMMVVDVETEPTFSVSRPRALFAVTSTDSLPPHSETTTCRPTASAS